MVANFRTLRWAKQDLLKGGLDHSVLNEVLPESYEITAEMIAQYVELTAGLVQVARCCNNSTDADRTDSANPSQGSPQRSCL